jgi:hypothetical protein
MDAIHHLMLENQILIMRGIIENSHTTTSLKKDLEFQIKSTRKELLRKKI